MKIDEFVSGGVAVIAANGRLTVETENEVSGAVRRAFERGRAELVLDLADVPYIDSCGLGTIAQAYVAAFRRGGAVKLANVAGRNRRLLAITKLLTVFEVFDSVDAAVRSFGRGDGPSVDVPQHDTDRKLSTMA